LTRLSLLLLLLLLASELPLWLRGLLVPTLLAQYTTATEANITNQL